MEIVLTKRLAKSGDSVCINIPKEICEAYGLKAGQVVRVKVYTFEKGLPKE